MDHNSSLKSSATGNRPGFGHWSATDLGGTWLPRLEAAPPRLGTLDLEALGPSSDIGYGIVDMSPFLCCTSLLLVLEYADVKALTSLYMTIFSLVKTEGG